MYRSCRCSNSIVPPRAKRGQIQEKEFVNSALTAIYAGLGGVKKSSELLFRVQIASRNVGKDGEIKNSLVRTFHDFFTHTLFSTLTYVIFHIYLTWSFVFFRYNPGWLRASSWKVSASRLESVYLVSAIYP